MERDQLCNFERGHHGEPFMLSCMKFGSVVQEEMSFKEKVYGRRKTDDGRGTKSDHNTSH